MVRVVFNDVIGNWAPLVLPFGLASTNTVAILFLLFFTEVVSPVMV
jgi:hypothetical protein